MGETIQLFFFGHLVGYWTQHSPIKPYREKHGLGHSTRCGWRASTRRLWLCLAYRNWPHQDAAKIAFRTLSRASSKQTATSEMRSSDGPTARLRVATALPDPMPLRRSVTPSVNPLGMRFRDGCASRYRHFAVSIKSCSRYAKSRRRSLAVAFELNALVPAPSP